MTAPSNRYGVAFDPNNPAAVQHLASDIASGKIDGGVLSTSVGSSGDLTALETRLAGRP